MTTDAQLAQAQYIVDNEDYLPSPAVRDAKKLLGIIEPDHVAEVLAEWLDIEEVKLSSSEKAG